MGKHKIRLIITCDLSDKVWGFSELLKDFADQGCEVDSNNPEVHKALCELVQEDLSGVIENAIWDFEITAVEDKNAE